MSTNEPFESFQNRLSSDHLSILPPPPPLLCSHKIQRLALSDPVSRTGSVCRWLLLPWHKLTEAFCSVACLLHSLVFRHPSSFSVTRVPVSCHPLSSCQLVAILWTVCLGCSAAYCCLLSLDGTHTGPERFASCLFVVGCIPNRIQQCSALSKGSINIC